VAVAFPTIALAKLHLYERRTLLPSKIHHDVAIALGAVAIRRNAG
jgi:hypothetical protein